MRARMALDVANITIEHREILLRDKPSTMLAASPKGTVPVLVTDAGVLDESLDIMNWALAQKDPEDWLVDGPQDRIDAERFLTDFKDKLDRYKYASRYDPSVPRGMVDTDYRREAMTLLSDFSLPLETTEFLRGDRPRLIDVSIFPFRAAIRGRRTHLVDHLSRLWVGPMAATLARIGTLRANHDETFDLE